MRIAGGTAKRITKRIINFILVIWGVVTLSFCLQVFTGTDPAEMIVRKVNVFATEEQIQAVREELGLDAPFLERYTDYIKGVLTGDLGTAITNRQPVIENIKDALPVTCMLVVMAMAWVIIFTVLIAAISVIRKGGIFDNVMRIICIIGICVPSFWLALILLTAFAVQIPIFNVISDGSFKSLILPSVAMAVPIICIAARVLRAAVLNELKSDYVTYARARGFSNTKIVYGEVLRNALPAAITLFAQYCAALFGTSALVESVFSIQGLGIYLMESCESMGLLGNAYRADGEILFQAENLLNLPKRKRQAIYGKEICLIMQNPMTAFNPSIRVGRQLEKTYLLHHGKTPKQEMQRLFAGILQRLGLEDTQRILNSYPFTLSGGMLQRLMIAAALMCQPALLVADEATTAIDACNRIGLMRELKSFCKDGMSVLFVTHDLRSASVSDRILVMDRGRIVEQGKTEQILNTPKEDYTKYLLNACRLERREMS